MSDWFSILFLCFIGLIILGSLGIALYSLFGGIKNMRENRRYRLARAAARKQNQYVLQTAPKSSPTFFFIIAAIFFGASALFATAVVGSTIYASNFQSGTCTIIASRLAPESVSVSDGSHQEYDSSTGEWKTVFDSHEEAGYRPNFEADVHTGPQSSVRANGPDVFASASTDRQAEQAILNHYEVGGTYACWYFRLDPKQITFSQPPPPNASMFFFLIPVVVTGLIGILFFFMAMRARRKRQVVLQYLRG